MRVPAARLVLIVAAVLAMVGITWLDISAYHWLATSTTVGAGLANLIVLVLALILSFYIFVVGIVFSVVAVFS